jgi:hypothetical protein
MLLRHSFIVIYVTAFIHTTGIFHHFSHSTTYTDQTSIIYLHMHIPLAITPIPLLTWHPPVVTGIVHLGPRLSVNCSPLFPIAPLCPPLQNPNPFSGFPEPNVYLIKVRLNPLPSIPNIYILFLSGNKIAVVHNCVCWSFVHILKDPFCVPNSWTICATAEQKIWQTSGNFFLRVGTECCMTLWP